MLFTTDEDTLKYLQKRNLGLQCANFLESLGRFLDAAVQHLEGGRTIAAIRLFRLDPTDRLEHRARACLLNALWAKLAFQGKPEVVDEDLRFLLESASDIIVADDRFYHEVSFLHINDRIWSYLICSRKQSFKRLLMRISSNSRVLQSDCSLRTRPLQFSALTVSFLVL